MEATPSEHLSRVVRDDETIEISAKPHRKAFLLANALGLTVAAGFLGLFFGVPALGAIAIGLSQFGSTELALGTIVAALPLAALVFPAVGYLAARHSYGHAEYAVTDDRVIETSGLVGRDASTVSLDDVRDVNVNVGLLGKLYDVGSIEFQTAGSQLSGITISHVENPYEVLEQVESLRNTAKKAAA